MFLESEFKLTDCPLKFALNCKRYKTHCHKCKANKAGKYLKYLPIDKSIIDHPINNKQKINNYSRRGRVDEKKLIQKSQYLKGTIGSGSIGKDGDAYIHLEGFRPIHIEIKNRYKENIPKPTSSEYKECKSQKIPIILINSIKANYSNVFINYKLFTNLWIRLLYCKDITWDISSLKSIGLLITIEHKKEDVERYTFIIQETKLTKDKKSFLKKHFKNLITIHYNNYGQYAIMSRNTFNLFIKLSKSIV